MMNKERKRANREAKRQQARRDEEDAKAAADHSEELRLLALTKLEEETGKPILAPPMSVTTQKLLRLRKLRRGSEKNGC